MSRVVRRKHIMKEMMEDDFELPKEQQQIVRVRSSRGNNLHEVEPADPEVEHFLVSMPCKYRKNVWVKRGDFILVEPIEEGDKVKAEICKILTAEHIKEYTKAGVWPKQFMKKHECETSESADSMDEDDKGFVVRNRNRPVALDCVETESEDDDEGGETTSSEDKQK